MLESGEFFIWNSGNQESEGSEGETDLNVESWKAGTEAEGQVESALAGTGGGNDSLRPR